MARFTNQAQLSYNNSVTNSNVVVGEILEVLAAAKTAVREQYGQNDMVTYIISITNSGTTAFSGITVTDNLGTYAFAAGELTPLTYVDGTIRYYQNGVIQAAPTVTAGPPLTISGITIPAGGSAVLVYEAAVNQYAPLSVQGEITNTAVISGTGITSVTVSETVTAESEPMLTITKSVNPVPVSENGLLTYTFLIQNSGNVAAEASSSAVITDTFDPILSNLSVTFNGAVWTEGTDYTYDAATGLFSTIAGKVTVPAAAYTQDTATGVWVTNPGVNELIVSGNV